MSEKIEVSLLGRNEIVREGLRRILSDEQFHVTSSVGDPSALRSDGTDHGAHNHIIIVDEVYAESGADSCRALQERFPDARLVVLADSFELEDVVRAFRSGVDGYLVKEISCEPLIGALRLVAMGEKVMPSQLARNLGDHRLRSGGGDWRSSCANVNLSDREIEILRCLILGYANKVISRRLNISEATVKVHVKTILRKLRVSNRTQAAIWAVQRGLDAYAAARPTDTTSLNDDEDEVCEEAIPDYAA